MNQPYTPETEPLPRLIYVLAQELKNIAEKMLAPYDVTVEQLHPLKIICLGEGISQRQIGEECNKTAANLTRILDRLQKKGLVERRGNPEDRRASLVYLTKRGEELLKEVTVHFDALTEKLMAGISSEEQDTVRNVLAKMTANQDQITREYQTR